MKKAPKKVYPIAKAISQAELEQYLDKIGRQIKKIRESRTSQESFAYEVGFSRAQQARYENGDDMLLSTFIKLLHGLDKSPLEFFKELK